MQEQFGDIEYREQDGRVWLVFPGKPADDVRGKLRSRGFKWSPTRGAWVRQLSEAARYYGRQIGRSEEHTSELQSLMRISYAVFCLKKKNKLRKLTQTIN